MIRHKFIRHLPVERRADGNLVCMGVTVRTEPVRLVDQRRLTDLTEMAIERTLDEATGSNQPHAFDPFSRLRACQRCSVPFIDHYVAQLCSDCRPAMRKQSVAKQTAKRSEARAAARSARIVACGQCGAIVAAARSTRRFCSGACRMRARRIAIAMRDAEKPEAASG